jgi:hypothetical protein
MSTANFTRGFSYWKCEQTARVGFCKPTYEHNLREGFRNQNCQQSSERGFSDHNYELILERGFNDQNCEQILQLVSALNILNKFYKRALVIKNVNKFTGELQETNGEQT